MRKREPIFLYFFICLLISIGVFGLSYTEFGKTLTKNIEFITIPIQSNLYNIGSFFTRKGEEQEYKEINRELLKKLVDQQKLLAENQALKDQFQTQYPKSSQLLPARIIGAPHFIPGVSIPQTFTLNKGQQDGVDIGEAVVVKDNLVGKISAVSHAMSQVLLITHPRSTFTAYTNTTNAQGIIKGNGSDEMNLENVLLSEELKKDDIILTKGDIDISGRGLPKDVIVGKIISVEKKPSSLFQTGRLKSLLNFSTLTEVFIITTE